jgi:hypothetical protein
MRQMYAPAAKRIGALAGGLLAASLVVITAKQMARRS